MLALRCNNVFALPTCERIHGVLLREMPPTTTATTGDDDDDDDANVRNAPIA
jgi:hypothetical protein